MELLNGRSFETSRNRLERPWDAVSRAVILGAQRPECKIVTLGIRIVNCALVRFQVGTGCLVEINSRTFVFAL